MWPLGKNQGSYTLRSGKCLEKIIFFKFIFGPTHSFFNFEIFFSKFVDMGYPMTAKSRIFRRKNKINFNFDVSKLKVFIIKKCSFWNTKMKSLIMYNELVTSEQQKTFHSWRGCNRFSFFRRQENSKVSQRSTPKSSLTYVPVTKSPYGARSRTCDTQPVNRRSTPKICQPRVSFLFSRMNAGHHFWEVCTVL